MARKKKALTLKLQKPMKPEEVAERLLSKMSGGSPPSDREAQPQKKRVT